MTSEKNAAPRAQLKPGKKNRLKFFTDLYNEEKTRSAQKLSELERCMRQYKTGSCDGYPFGGARCSTVRNITYELIEAEVSSDIPRPRVTPAIRDAAHEKNADAIETLCRNLRDRLPLERLNDIDERMTYIYGGSVWLVEWDAKNSRPVISCIDPMNFIPQSGVTDIDSMEYCFVTGSRTREDIFRTFGRLIDGGGSASSDEAELPQVVICYWRDESGCICRYVFCGDTELCDDIDFYARREEVAEDCRDKTPSQMHSILLTEESLTEPLRTVSGIIPRGRVPYYRIRSFPIIIRKNVTRTASLYGQSDCEIIRPQQDAINRLESRIFQKLTRSAVIPFMPEDSRITPTNSVFGEVIRMDAGDNSSKFGTIDTTPDITQDCVQSDRLYNQARRLLGITDSFTGESDSAAASGYAISLQVSQSAGRLRSRRIMKNALYADLDRLVFEHYLAFCDNDIALGYTDAYGTRHENSFSRYNFLKYDGSTGQWVYDDDYMFSVDKSVSSDSGEPREMWQITLELYRGGLFGAPDSDRARQLCWSRLEQLGYPDSHNAAEFFGATGAQ